MVVVSVTLNWHWFADLIAGLIVGAVVLELTIAADAALPRAAFDGGLVAGSSAGPWRYLRRTASVADPGNPAA